jgi:hypothetical protein
MANNDLGRIDLSLISDLAAMAATLDVHWHSPSALASASKGAIQKRDVRAKQDVDNS